MEMNERNLESTEIPVCSTIVDHSSIEIKKPKRLYFSDGIMEEFSEEENEELDNNEIVESELEWGSWLIHKSVKTGSNVLAACDYVGGKLAAILGITAPKFGSEIEDYRNRQDADNVEKADSEKEKREYSSWNEPNKYTEPITIQEPSVKKY